MPEYLVCFLGVWADVCCEEVSEAVAAEFVHWLLSLVLSGVVVELRILESHESCDVEESYVGELFVQLFPSFAEPGFDVVGPDVIASVVGAGEYVASFAADPVPVVSYPGTEYCSSCFWEDPWDYGVGLDFLLELDSDLLKVGVGHEITKFDSTHLCYPQACCCHDQEDSLELSLCRGEAVPEEYLDELWLEGSA